MPPLSSAPRSAQTTTSGRAGGRGPIGAWSCAILAAAFTLLLVQWSIARGKLAVFPPPDELTFLNDALWRLSNFYAAGIGRLIAQWFQSPPASPLRGALTLLGYTLFGIHDWAPYAINGVVLFALLCQSQWIVLGLRRWQRCLVLIFVLTMPLCGELVNTLQPELLAMLLSAGGATLLVVRSNQEHRRWRVGAGACFGLAILAEPALFPFILLFMIAALICGWLASDRQKGNWTWREVFRRLLEPTLVALAISLPVLLPRFHTLFTRMSLLLPPDQVLRHRPMSRWLFYLSGKGGERLMGAHLVILAFIVLTGLAAAIRLKLPVSTRRISMLLVLAGVAYFLATILLPGRILMGACPILLLVNAALVGLNLLGQLQPTAVAATAILLPLLAGLGLGRFPSRQYDYASPVAAARKHAALGMYQALQENLGLGTRVIFCGGGDPDEAVNPPVLEYLARKDERAGFNLTQAAAHGPLPERMLEETDYAVVALNSAAGDVMRLKALRNLRRSPAFETLVAFPISSFESYCLLKRLPPFVGFDSASGLEPEEGPYPAWRIDHPVRWGVGVETIFRFTADKAKLVRIAIAAESRQPGQHLTVLVNGGVIAERVLSPQNVERVDTVVDLPAGTHELRCRYSPAGQIDASGRALAVLFHSVRLLAGGGYMGPPEP